MQETLILAGGVFNLAFAIFHLFFWHIFRWKKELSALSFTNRNIMQILNLCLIFIFLMMAYVSFFHVEELVQTPIGHTLLRAFALFWFARTIEQIVFFGFKNRISVVLTLTFFIGGVFYLIPSFKL